LAPGSGGLEIQEHDTGICSAFGDGRGHHMAKGKKMCGGDLLLLLLLVVVVVVFVSVMAFELKVLLLLGRHSAI
jgi:hypothetical protein